MKESTGTEIKSKPENETCDNELETLNELEQVKWAGLMKNQKQFDWNWQVRQEELVEQVKQARPNDQVKRVRPGEQVKQAKSGEQTRQAG